MKIVAIVGVGNVGSALERQIRSKARNDLQLVAVCNSKLMLLSPGASSDRLPSEGVPIDFPGLLAYLENFVFEHADFVPVLVDCTASTTVPLEYQSFIQKKIRIVTANKAVFERSKTEVEPLVSSPLFAYETTCGAGLPMISTLKAMVATGDQVKIVRGILSGTLSYVFSQVEKGVAFSTAVLDAKSRGYTEPDPRDDLSGRDVMRKLLILARTLYLPIDMTDIAVKGLVSELDQTPTLDEFLSSRLPAMDADISALKEEAESEDSVLRFLAEIDAESNRALVQLTKVSKSSLLAAAKDTDNVFQIVSSRYPTGLIIIGPGAGVEVTAMGVFADILAIN